MSNRELIRRMEIDERELTTMITMMSLLRCWQEQCESLAWPLTADETAAFLERLKSMRMLLKEDARRFKEVSE